MVASNDKELLNNVLKTGGERLLRTTALYGANASGKTNLFKVIAIVSSLIISSNYRTPNMAMPISSFKLSEDTINKPSEFEIKFIYDGIRYVYGFTADNLYVYNESLYYYPKKKVKKETI